MIKKNKQNTQKKNLYFVKEDESSSNSELNVFHRDKIMWEKGNQFLLTSLTLSCYFVIFSTTSDIRRILKSHGNCQCKYI